MCLDQGTTPQRWCMKRTPTSWASGSGLSLCNKGTGLNRFEFHFHQWIWMKLITHCLVAPETHLSNASPRPRVDCGWICSTLNCNGRVGIALSLSISLVPPLHLTVLHEFLHVILATTLWHAIISSLKPQTSHSPCLIQLSDSLDIISAMDK